MVFERPESRPIDGGASWSLIGSRRWIPLGRGNRCFVVTFIVTTLRQVNCAETDE